MKKTTKCNKIQDLDQTKSTTLGSPKMSLAEKQAIKLQQQKERQAKKLASGENEPKNKERFYCTSAELTAELIKWRDSSKKIENRIISEELGRMMMAIADKLLNRSEFRNYSKEIKEEAKGFFYVKAIKGLKNYNFEFNNPFAYFTTCAWNAYITVIGKEYKQKNIKRGIMMQLLSTLETYNGLDPKSSLSNTIRQYLESEQLNDATQL